MPRPTRAAIAREHCHAALAKYPTALAVSERRTHHSHTVVSASESNALPGQSTIVCSQQVTARFIVRLKFENIAFANQPSVVVIGKVNIAQIVFGWRMNFGPCLAAVGRFEERSLAACYPTMITIEKVNRMEPGHRAGVLATP